MFGSTVVKFTETSTLTVLSVPVIAYTATPAQGGMTYLTLALGYIVGRIIVSFVLLPRYIAGDLVTAYAFLGKRYGDGMRATASVTFLFTRLLADGIRLFATAIPIKVVLAGYGITASYWAIVAALGIAMVFYSFFGGARAVVWVDAIQMLWYVLGGVVVVWVLAGQLPDGWFSKAADADKFQLFDFTSSPLTGAYPFIAAFFGGALLSMASHGADQLIVQRLMATRDVKSAQKALIASGFVVFLQFAFFLFIGVMMWAFYAGVDPVKDLKLNNKDELFTSFLEEAYPVTREMNFEFSATDPLERSLPNYGESAIGGTFSEIISGLHRNDIAVEGLFTLTRTTATPSLNQ